MLFLVDHVLKETSREIHSFEFSCTVFYFYRVQWEGKPSNKNKKTSQKDLEVDKVDQIRESRGQRVKESEIQGVRESRSQRIKESESQVVRESRSQKF